MLLRLLYDEVRKRATIVADNVSDAELKKLANDVLNTRIEYITGLKSDNTDIPDALISDDSSITPDTTSSADKKEESENTAEGVIVTNPVPEDSKFFINTSILDTPVEEAPSMFSSETDNTSSNDNTQEEVSAETTANAVTENVSTPSSTVATPDEKYKFTFGKFNGKTIGETLESNSKNAVNYILWMYNKGIVEKRIPEKETFRKEVFNEVVDFYSAHHLTDNEELREVAALLITVMDSEDRDCILAIIDYSNANELFEANNHEDNMTVISSIETVFDCKITA